MPNPRYEQLTRELQELDVYTPALIATLWGFLSAGYIIVSFMQSRNVFLIMGLFLYIGATIVSVQAGKAIKKIDDPVWAEHVNRTVQRRSVILLNSSVGAAIVAATLFTDPMRMMIPLAILAGFGILYAISYFTKFIKPHSFAARFRSAIGRGLLVGVLVYLAAPQFLYLTTGIILGVLYVTWKNLRKDQVMYGWPDR